jgi:hypothetical protein
MDHNLVEKVAYLGIQDYKNPMDNHSYFENNVDKNHRLRRQNIASH